MLIVSLCVGACLLVLAGLQIRSERRTAAVLEREVAGNLTLLLAEQMGPAVRWVQPLAVRSIYAQLRAGRDDREGREDLAGLAVTGVNGRVIDVFRPNLMARLDYQSMIAGHPARMSITRWEDYLVVVSPIRTGKARQVYGYLTTVWQFGHVVDSIRRNAVSLAAVAMLMMLTLAIVLLLLLRRYVTRPMRRGEAKLENHVRELFDATSELEVKSLQLDRHRSELEATVAARTRELETQAGLLESALDRERAVNVEQRQFVSMVSHEFRTPLAIIDASAHRLARRATSPEKLAEHVSVIRSSVNRMTLLMESILGVAALDAGSATSELAPCDLREVLGTVIAQHKAIFKIPAIGADLEALPPRIIADARQVAQILTSLVSNAVKYSTGQPDIRVRGWTSEAYAVISVANVGIGIPGDELERIFERYYRASSASGIPGSGLGLSLARSLVELHEGSIEAESGGAGGLTVFTVMLPIDGPENSGAA